MRAQLSQFPQTQSQQSFTYGDVRFIRNNGDITGWTYNIVAQGVPKFYRSSNSTACEGVWNFCQQERLRAAGVCFGVFRFFGGSFSLFFKFIKLVFIKWLVLKWSFIPIFHRCKTHPAARQQSSQQQGSKAEQWRFLSGIIIVSSDCDYLTFRSGI